MSRLLARLHRDERGASLILAIAFMVVIGSITGAVLSSISSGLGQRATLDLTRNREYAADGLVEYAITQARAPAASWNEGSPPVVTTFINSASSVGCGGPFTSSTVPVAAQLNNVNNLRVDCTPAPALTRAGYLQRNAIFTACINNNNPCTAASAIVRAQVNFSDTASGPTTVQSWSVNG
jgi:hypothetical protein